MLCCCALINPEWAVMAGKIPGDESINFLFFLLAETVYTSSCGQRALYAAYLFPGHCSHDLDFDRAAD